MIIENKYYRVLNAESYGETEENYTDILKSDTVKQIKVMRIIKRNMTKRDEITKTALLDK